MRFNKRGSTAFSSAIHLPLFLLAFGCLPKEEAEPAAAPLTTWQVQPEAATSSSAVRPLEQAELVASPLSKRRREQAEPSRLRRRVQKLLPGLPRRDQGGETLVPPSLRSGGMWR